MRVRLQVYLFISLSVLYSYRVFIRFRLCQQLPQSLSCLVISVIYKYVFIVIFKPRTAYFKITVSIILIHTKRRVVWHFTSENVLSILWMHRWNIGFWLRLRVKQRHLTDYTFPFGLCFKTRFGTVSFYNGNRFPFLFFSFQVWVLMETNLDPFVITMVFSFKYILNRRWW